MVVARAAGMAVARVAVARTAARVAVARRQGSIAVLGAGEARWPPRICLAREHALEHDS